MSTLGAILGLIAAAAVDCRAQSIPGIGTPDHRIRVEPIAPPWDAVARVQTNIGTRCTGFLLAPDAVVTAAHCLYNRRTRALLQPVSLHVLLGFEGGNYRWHEPVRHYVVGSGFDGTRPGAHPEADWARLELAAPIPPAVAPLAVAPMAPEPGSAVALAGYNRDKALVLMADLSCRIVATVALPGADLLAHNCSATHGTSGGPLLARDGAGWRVVGINIAIAQGDNVALWSAGFAKP